jgi:predicted transcriptional regulator
VKSVRLDSDLEARLERAARATGMSQSEFLRHALANRCDEVLGRSLAEALAPVIGIVSSSGGRAANTGAAFRKLLKRKRRR